MSKLFKTNKHVTVAMIVAPLLAVISYFATDYIVSDEPIVAVEGSSYALLPRSNCRYQSGQCTLRNGDIEINLRMTSDPQGRYALEAKSSQPLEGLKLALTPEGSADQPVGLSPVDEQRQHWSMALHQVPANDVELRLATRVDGTHFYASTETTFFEYDTVFPRSDW